MESLRDEIAKRLQQERSEYDRLMASVEQLYAQGALATEGPAQSVYVEGASNLVITEQDKERLRQLLATLEEKQRVVDLLSAYLDTRQEAVRVVVGLEDTMPHLNNFVLIGTPARVWRRGDGFAGRHRPHPHGLRAHHHRRVVYRADVRSACGTNRPSAGRPSILQGSAYGIQETKMEAPKRSWMLDHELPSGAGRKRPAASEAAEANPRRLDSRVCESRIGEGARRDARLSRSCRSPAGRVRQLSQAQRQASSRNIATTRSPMRCKTLLPILDSLDRALKTDAASLTIFTHGIELIDKQFHDALAKLGVSPCPLEGESFDPNLHQAVQMVDTDEAEDNHVIDELQRGYKLKRPPAASGDGARRAQSEDG